MKNNISIFYLLGFINNYSRGFSSENGKFASVSSGHIFPNDIDKYDKAVWEKDIEKIKFTLSHFGYNLLTKEELEKPLDFNVNIASNLIDGKP